MKKSFFVAVAAAVMALTSCVSLHSSAYVAEAEDFSGETIEYNGLKNELTCGEYKIDFNRMVNKVVSVSIFGVGKKAGNVYKSGVFMKDGKELFEVMVLKNEDGIVLSGENWFFESTNPKLIIQIKNDTMDQIHVMYPNGDTETELVADGDFEFEMTKVSDSKDEKGKVYHMLFDANVGSKVVVNGMTYAVVDDIYNPARIRVNPNFDGALTQSEKDNIMAMIMMVYYTKNYFLDQSECGSLSIGL